LLNGESFLFKLADRDEQQDLHYIKSCVLHLTIILVRNCFQIGFKVEELFNISMEHAKVLMQAGSLQEIRIFLREFLCQLLNISSIKNKSDKYAIVMKAKAYINCHFHRAITLDEVARVVYLSPCYFSRLFSEVSGCTFQDYLTKVRINEAQKLLIEKKISLEEITTLLGYNDVSYFIRVFKKVVGLTPRQFAQGFNV